ncbi:MAG: 50S ribosomal protein L13 [Methanomassiliicoccales archaeon PtaU1.Bin124]|nr:MAG: 50S ribosomal protein L13 [Methanomassiliicoccales archaeon PtaU1.Bin124]
MIVYDAEKQVAGRMATEIAHKLKQGETIVIVNAERAIITGDRDNVFEKFKAKRDRGYAHSGPFFPRRADLILKRIVRGMLPYDRPNGRDAYHRLKVYVGVPEEFAAAEKVKVEAASRITTSKYVTVGEIANFLGSKVK